jgi:putative membrane protein
MNDGQVLGVLVAANQGEIDFSQMGVTKAKDAAVKKFAQMMVKHHTEGLTKAKKAVSESKLETAPSEVTQKLDTSVKDERAKLETGGDAKTFDVQFMCAQIRMHSDLLKTIDEKLLPGAQDAHVKGEVTATKPVVASHLDEARGVVQ